MIAPAFDSARYCAPLAGVQTAADVTWVAELSGGGAIALIDTVGYGSPSELVTDRVRRGLNHLGMDDFPAVFNRLHRELDGTQGASIAIARFSAVSGYIEFAGLGKIYGAIAGSERIVLASQPGIVGVGMPRTPVVHKFPWLLGTVVVLAVDGLVDSWDFTGLWSSAKLPLDTMIRRIARRSRLPDDASVVIARAR